MGGIGPLFLVIGTLIKLKRSNYTYSGDIQIVLVNIKKYDNGAVLNLEN